MLLLLHWCAAIYSKAVRKWSQNRVQLFITDNCCSCGGLVLSLCHGEQRVSAIQRKGISCAVVVSGLHIWRLVVDPWPFALEGVLSCVPKVPTLQQVFVHRRGSNTHVAAIVKFYIRIPWWNLMIVLAWDISSHKEWWGTIAILGTFLIATSSHVEDVLPDQDHGLHVILMNRLSPCFHVFKLLIIIYFSLKHGKYLYIKRVIKA